jgi:hypothetical protein
MGSKCLTLDVGHMCKNNLAKKHVWLSIETHFEFFGIYYISSIKSKYSYTIMYECENSPLTHELPYIGLFNFFHLCFFHINVICKK